MNSVFWLPAAGKAQRANNGDKVVKYYIQGNLLVLSRVRVILGKVLNHARSTFHSPYSVSIYFAKKQSASEQRRAETLFRDIYA